MDTDTKGRPKVDTHLDSCPYLGKVDDPTNSYAQPTRRHRCYRWEKPLLVRREDQRTYCLTAAHTQCPRLTDREALPVPGVSSPWGAKPRARRHRRPRSPWSVQGLSRREIAQRFLPLLLLLAAAVLITWVLARGTGLPGRGAEASASATPPTSTPTPSPGAGAAGLGVTPIPPPTEALPPPTAIRELPATAEAVPPATPMPPEGAFQSPLPEPTPTFTLIPTLEPPPLPELHPPTPEATPTPLPNVVPTATPVPTLPPTSTWTPTATQGAHQSPLPTPTPFPWTPTPFGATATPTVGASAPTSTATPTPTRTPYAYATPTRTPSPPPATPYWNYVVVSDRMSLEWQGVDTCAKVYGTVRDTDGTLLTDKDGIAIHVEWWWGEVWIGKEGWPPFHADGTYEFCLNRGQFTVTIVDQQEHKRTSQRWWFDIDIRNFTGRVIYEINWQRVR